MKLEVAQVMSIEEVRALVEEMVEGKISKGATIRTLFAGGLSVKEIATETGIRYNHVYNVVKNEIVVNGLEVVKTGRGGENSKKAQIERMLQEGKSITEIAAELQCLYNYVWQVAKKAGYTKPATTTQVEEVAEVSIDDAQAMEQLGDAEVVDMEGAE